MDDVLRAEVAIWAECVFKHFLRLFERVLKVALLVVLLHAQLDLAHRHHVIGTRVLLLEVLVYQRRSPQEEHCRLGLDEVLNEHGTVDELEENEGAVDETAYALVR